MKIAVVIPCRNEVQYIEECLNAIFGSILKVGYELDVYVVDGMSDDGTREVIAETKNKFKNLVLIDNEKQLTPYAFNLGIYAGRPCDYVQIIGARHIVTDDYIQKGIDVLSKNPEIWCVGGRIINEYTNDISRIISSAMGTSFGMGLGNFRTLSSSGYTDTVTSPLYPYWVFEKIGFFDEDLVRNQDDDFNFRVTKAGGKVYYIHEVSLKYYVRANFKGLWRQFYQYGYWKVFVNKKHKAITTVRQLVPPLFVMYLILLPLFFLLGWQIGTFFTLPLLIYLLLNFYVSFKLARNFRSFLQLTMTYMILHVSYGIGYWSGIINFVLLGNKPSKKQARLSR